MTAKTPACSEGFVTNRPSPRRELERLGPAIALSGEIAWIAVRTRVGRPHPPRPYRAAPVAAGDARRGPFRGHRLRHRGAREAAARGAQPGGDGEGLPGHGGRQPRQERVSGQHEPRNPHAAQRHPRVHRTVDPRGRRRRPRRTPGVPPDDPPQRTAPPGADQRHPRPVEDRGRAAGGRADPPARPRKSWPG